MNNSSIEICWWIRLNGQGIFINFINFINSILVGNWSYIQTREQPKIHQTFYQFTFFTVFIYINDFRFTFQHIHTWHINILISCRQHFLQVCAVLSYVYEVARVCIWSVVWSLYLVYWFTMVYHLLVYLVYHYQVYPGLPVYEVGTYEVLFVLSHLWNLGTIWLYVILW